MSQSTSRKRTLLVVIDALAARVVIPAMEEGRLPTLQALAQAGVLRERCTSIFPSITPAATTSIVTGRYPADHGIAGAFWYDPERKTVAYYGYDFWVILRRGIDDFVNDFLVRLNQDRLRAATLFERVEDRDRTAASLNYLIHRGRHQHSLQGSGLAGLVPGISLPDTLQGPTMMSFGDLIPFGNDGGPEDLDNAGGPFNRFGFSDANTGKLLLQLAQEDRLPDFTLAYFPDNDFRSHEVGPQQALDAVEAVDGHLGQLLDARGGLEAALQELCVVVTGDHSQAEMVDDEERSGIHLGQLLDGFALAEAGEPMEHEDDLVACPNLRTAQLYFTQPTRARMDRVSERLLQDDRVDQVIWNANTLSQDETGFVVVTAGRGRLRVWPGDQGEQAAADRYGNRWRWEGDLAAVDGWLDEEGVLQFGDYPNAFERLAGGLNLAGAGHLWATARPGYEFRLEDTTVHTGGGSHGSLHASDSVALLLVAGAPDGVEIPQHPRLIDVAPLCLAVLGLA